MRVEKEPAFILHQRGYSETSVILDVFSKNYGRLSLIAKGAKKQVSNKGSVLNQFQQLSFSWVGKSDLKTMTNVETTSGFSQINSDAVYCGFYVNELILRLLHQDDPHPELFNYYSELIESFSDGMSEMPLRIFEKKLLTEIGYGVILNHDIHNHDIEPEEDYYYLPQQGPIKSEEQKQNTGMITIKGKNLLALFRESFDDQVNMLEIKKLMRTLLQSQLGEKPLRSRKLMNDLVALHKN